MVPQSVIIHFDASLLQGYVKILFRQTLIFHGFLDKNLSNGEFFLFINKNFIGTHPSFEHSFCFESKEFEHPTIVFCGNKLPSATKKMQPNDFSFIESLPESFEGWMFGTHGNSPPYHAVILCLHGSHVGYNILGLCKLWRDELL